MSFFDKLLGKNPKNQAENFGAVVNAAVPLPKGNTGKPRTQPNAIPVPTDYILMPGDQGDAVATIQGKLAQLGFNPGAIDGDYGNGTTNAVRAFQQTRNIPMSGAIDAVTMTALGYRVNQSPFPDQTTGFSVAVVKQMFPDAPLANIQTHLPNVLASLQRFGLGDAPMICMALSTIRAETAGFVPLSEFVSKYNTAPGGSPFALYDNRPDIGNNAQGDGAKYKGRGFIQLTGKANYQRLSLQLGMGNQLLIQPDLANQSPVAADILACFLKNAEGPIRQALRKGDMAAARKLVNGGRHGLNQFTLAYQTGAQLVGLA
jgi:hypothetical protein